MGKVSGEKVARLKDSFNHLHETLRRVQASEMHQLQEAKTLHIVLEEQKQELEKAELFPEGPDTEVSKLKQTLLHFYNQLKQDEERNEQIQFQLECLKEERLCLEKEYQNPPNNAEIQHRYMVLKKACEELKGEVALLKKDVRTLTEDLETQQKQLKQEQLELEKLNESIENGEAELARMLVVPAQLKKEAKRVGHGKLELENQIANMDQNLKEHREHLQRIEKEVEQLKEAKTVAIREWESYKAQRVSAENKQDRLLTDLQVAKAKEAVFMDQRGLLEINMEQVTSESLSLREKLARDVQLKDKLMRVLKRNELQLKKAGEALDKIQQQYELTKAQKETVPEADILLQRRRDLEKEVENLQRSLVGQESVAEMKVQLAQKYVEQEQALMKESYQCRDELHHLHHLILIKADEREQKSHELLKAKLKYNSAKQDLQGKGLVIQEHLKQIKEAQSRLGVFAKLYEITKGERNKYLSLIQISDQNRTELLQRSRLQHSHSYKIRDHVKNEISKKVQVVQEMHRKHEEEKLNLSKLSHTVNVLEDKKIQMRKSYEAALQERNERAVQLVEREQELCIFYKKLNELVTMTENFNLKINDLEDEIRNLKIEQKEEDRQNSLQRKQLSCRRALQNESIALQIQLSEVKDRLMELEQACVDHNRARKLSGGDPSAEELIKKIDQMEIQMVDKEAQLLEMELVFEQVTRLSQRMQLKADNGKEDSLDLAKNANDLQIQIKNRSRKMMAVVAELSMRKAECMVLQQEIKEKELQMDMYRCVLAEEDEWNQLPNGVYTTAEPRPNAYIPTADPLPVPKHYGALAPFKPTEPGSNIRHIRKPKYKPIEI
ncbi:hypothetical protein DNTS_025543 [Danionella cerebrum]|uniref:Coiled-coil domain-containing protein 146 n=1 Tax=Danionella cerebrum TaxID=2873325 RepID=A0A553REW9_9TELE|nr:hypothetical protein DNTS_025543 [Danionella translucida]